MRTLSAIAYKKNLAKKKRNRLNKLAVLILLWAAIIGVTNFHGNVASGKNRVPVTVVVETGDTLWGLARQHAPRGVDTRDYVYHIAQANNLKSSTVYPGQILELP